MVDVADVWGTVLACGDLNGDDRADLAIGSGTNPSSRTPPTCCAFEEHPEGLTVIYGSATGLDGSTAVHITSEQATGQPDGNPYGGRFAYALAVGDLDGDEIDDLVALVQEGITSTQGGILVFRGQADGIDQAATTMIDEGEMADALLPRVPSGIRARQRRSATSTTTGTATWLSAPATSAGSTNATSTGPAPTPSW